MSRQRLNFHFELDEQIGVVAKMLIPLILVWVECLGCSTVDHSGC